ncbi:acetate kinase [Bacteroidales bacterium OttesenSCG-928-I14]|nr:acetate kinase [Bacteroidales bacterium OttesenSCG-928-I14]
MKILVLNCGSSSIKYKLFDMTANSTMAQGGIDKIGLKGSALKFTSTQGDKVILEGEILEHKVGIEYILGVITSEKYGCIKSLEEIDAVGHRVAHGGEVFKSSALITDEVIQQIEACTDLAPLHNPSNLQGIYAIKSLLPSVPQVAVFDTAYHQTMPSYAYMYGIPYSLYEKYAIRRYGFHGTSHRYVSRKVCEFLGLDYEKQKIVTCHLGNGASIAAIKNGKSIDTSMGMTPVEGLLMGTRAGDVDAGVLTYIMDKENIGSQAISTIVNKYSGVLGVSGVSSDMREIDAAINEGNERAKLAIEMYTYRIRKYIGAYIAAMEGVDVIIFTGGVGENQISIRKTICDSFSYLGLKIDDDRNNTRGEDALITADDSSVHAAVIPTDEELMIAQDTLEILG